MDTQQMKTATSMIIDKKAELAKKGVEADFLFSFSTITHSITISVIGGFGAHRLSADEFLTDLEAYLENTGNTLLGNKSRDVYDLVNQRNKLQEMIDNLGGEQIINN